MLRSPEHLRKVVVTMRSRWDHRPSDAPGALCLNEVQCDTAELSTIKLLTHDSKRRKPTIDGIAIDATIHRDTGLVFVIPDENLSCAVADDEVKPSCEDNCGTAVRVARAV